MAAPIIFKLFRPRAGKPLALRGLARMLSSSAKAWSTLGVLGGHVDWSHGTPTIVVPSATSPTFTVRGTEGLFKIVALRAYLNSDDSLVSEGTAFNSSTMYLHPTWDYERWP